MELSWRWDRKRKPAVQRRYLGKRVLFTDQDEWDSLRMVSLVIGQQSPVS